jgi:hypothetical protein
MVDTEVGEGKIFRVNPLHRNKLGSVSKLYVLRKNIDTMIVMDVPKFRMMKSESSTFLDLSSSVLHDQPGPISITN